MAASLNWALEKMGWRVPDEDIVEDDFTEVAEVHEYPFPAVETKFEEETTVATKKASHFHDAPQASKSDEDRRRIATIHPRNYSDALQVGEFFRDGVPVIMNLTDMDDAEARRIIDFAAGLAFGLHGEIERVTTRVFLLSPKDTVVSNGRSSGRLTGYR